MMPLFPARAPPERAADEIRLSMDHQRLGLRAEIEVRPDPDHPGGLLLHDPVSRRFVRITPEQAAVLSALELHRGFCDVAEAASQQSGKPITAIYLAELALGK